MALALTLAAEPTKRRWRGYCYLPSIGRTTEPPVTLDDNGDFAVYSDLDDTRPAPPRIERRTSPLLSHFARSTCRMASPMRAVL
jgi:hypothetical protein